MGFDRRDFDKRIDLADLKSGIDKIDIVKLETAPADLSKLSNEEKEVVEKAIYNELAKQVNAVWNNGTSGVVKKADCNTKIEEKIL